MLARAYEPNTAYQAQIDAAAREAQESETGMWAPTACASTFGAALAIVEIEANPPGPDENDLNGEWVVIVQHRRYRDRPDRLDACGTLLGQPLLVPDRHDPRPR